MAGTSLAEEKKGGTRVAEHAGAVAVVPQPSPVVVPASSTPSSDIALTFERLARDPAVDVEKLERLIAMQERIMGRNAKAAFAAAFAKMQPEIPTIDEHGRIEVKGQLRSTYAPLEDIHEVIKPITARHGFAVRHRTEWPAESKIIRIVGILSHEQGHSEETIFEAPMDRSEFRSDIQSMGSTISYGRRYTTLDLLNISTRKADNDGQRRKAETPEAPAKFDSWWTDMEALADEGWPPVEKAWSLSSAVFKNHVIKHMAEQWKALKVKALKVQS